MNRRFTLVKSEPVAPPEPLSAHEQDKLRMLTNAFEGVSPKIQKAFVQHVLDLSL